MKLLSFCYDPKFNPIQITGLGHDTEKRLTEKKYDRNGYLAENYLNRKFTWPKRSVDRKGNFTKKKSYRKSNFLQNSMQIWTYIANIVKTN
jgi:hypothetical protein